MIYIYLHGYNSGPKSVKAKLFKKLFTDRKFKLHIPDLNGKNFSELTLTGQMETIETIMRENKGPVTLIGSSMGGFISCMLAEKHPRIKKLVLLAPAFGFIPLQKKLLGKKGIADWKKNGFMIVQHNYYNEKRNLNFTFFTDCNKYEKFKFSRNLPVLIFHGLEDQTVPYQVSLDYFKSHPQSSLYLMQTDHKLNDPDNMMGTITAKFLKI